MNLFYFYNPNTDSVLRSRPEADGPDGPLLVMAPDARAARRWLATRWWGFARGRRPGLTGARLSTCWEPIVVSWHVANTKEHRT